MDFSVILAGLVVKFPILGTILLIFGVLVVIAQIYVAMTPTQSDDAFFAKVEAMPIVGDLLKALVSFAPIQRKVK